MIQLYELIHTYEWWLLVIQGNYLPALTLEDLDKAKDEKKEYIGKFNGIDCYLFYGWV